MPKKRLTPAEFKARQRAERRKTLAAASYPKKYDRGTQQRG